LKNVPQWAIRAFGPEPARIASQQALLYPSAGFRRRQFTESLHQHRNGRWIPRPTPMFDVDECREEQDLLQCGEQNFLVSKNEKTNALQSMDWSDFLFP
jgi:hypothetical protein